MTTDCPCCRARGVLPHMPGRPEFVLPDVVGRMCDPCIDAAFLGGQRHPHPITGMARHVPRQ